jgi:hypothetical protein
VPKLCLGTQVAKLGFASAPPKGEDAKPSFAPRVPEQSSGTRVLLLLVFFMFFVSFVSLW